MRIECSISYLLSFGTPKGFYRYRNNGKNILRFPSAIYLPDGNCHKSVTVTPRIRTDGRMYGWTDVRTHYVTTKFSRLHSLPYFLTYGATLCGPSTPKGAPLKYTIFIFIIVQKHHIDIPILAVGRMFVT